VNIFNIFTGKVLQEYSIEQITCHEKYDAPHNNLASNLCDPHLLLALLSRIKSKTKTQAEKKNL
jgi:hypothetical protein